MPDPTKPTNRPLSAYSPSAWQNLFDEDPDGWKFEATETPRSIVAQPDSPTHFVCPDGALDESNPTLTHNLRTAGNVLRCRYCGKTEKQLRTEIGL